jgi:hypothetical protein
MTSKLALMTVAMCEVIREKKEIPSGVLYSCMLGHMSLEEYNVALASLKSAKLVSEKSFLLTWIGPELTKQ